MRIEEPGWCRIGRYCSAMRRSIWFRMVRNEAAIPDAFREIGCFIANPTTVEAIELCAGREGEDVYVRIEQDGTATFADGKRWDIFAALLDVCLAGEYAAALTEEEGDWEDPEQLGEFRNELMRLRDRVAELESGEK
jgi:hypothetical protein